MPVAVSGPIDDGWGGMKGALSPEGMKRLQEAGVVFEQGGRLLLDFVGLPELGHAHPGTAELEPVMTGERKGPISPRLDEV